MSERLVPGKSGGRSEAKHRAEFMLLDGELISLPKLASQITERSDGDGRVHVGFVYATGRSPHCMAQIGLACDGLYVPEITNSLASQLPRESSLEPRSYLDIDMLRVVNANGDHTNWPERPHLILSATGDINFMTAEVFRIHEERLGYPIRPGVLSPFSADLIGCNDNTRFSAQFQPNAAVLVAVQNPWWPDRIVVICGGIFGIGTVGALWMLWQYVCGSGQSWGNNRLDPHVAGKIIDAVPDAYSDLVLRDHRELRPEHDIRNVAFDQGEVVRVLE